MGVRSWSTRWAVTVLCLAVVGPSQAEDAPKPKPKSKGHVQAETQFNPTDVPARFPINNPDSLAAHPGDWVLGVDHYVLDDLKAGLDVKAPITPYKYIAPSAGWSTLERVVRVAVPNALIWPLPSAQGVGVGDLVVTFEEDRVRSAVGEVVAVDETGVTAVLMTPDGAGLPKLLAPGTFGKVRDDKTLGAPVVWRDKTQLRWGLWVARAGEKTLIVEGEHHLAMVDTVERWDWVRNPAVGDAVQVADGVLVTDGTIVSVDGFYVVVEFERGSKKAGKTKVQERMPRIRVAARPVS